MSTLKSQVDSNKSGSEIPSFKPCQSVCRQTGAICLTDLKDYYIFKWSVMQIFLKCEKLDQQLKNSNPLNFDLWSFSSVKSIFSTKTTTSNNKLGLSCAKLRANLNLSVFVWYVRFSMLGLVCFNWFVWLTCFVWNILFGRFGLVSQVRLVIFLGQFGLLLNLGWLGQFSQVSSVSFVNPLRADVLESLVWPGSKSQKLGEIS